MYTLRICLYSCLVMLVYIPTTFSFSLLVRFHVQANIEYMNLVVFRNWITYNIGPGMFPTNKKNRFLHFIARKHQRIIK